jgi:hypothetical protein
MRAACRAADGACDRTLLAATVAGDVANIVDNPSFIPIAGKSATALMRVRAYGSGQELEWQVKLIITALLPLERCLDCPRQRSLQECRNEHHLQTKAASCIS